MKYLLFSLIFISVLSASQAQTTGELKVITTTSDANGNYAPKNILAIWVEDSQGNFVKTLMAYASNKITYLNIWQASTTAAGTEFNTADAITGVTRTSHSTRECSWDATDYNGNLMPDGEYFLWMELTDKHQTGNYSSFSFNKTETPESQTPDNVPSFSDISIEWTPLGTAVESVTKTTSLNIYPNPGNGVFTIDNQDIEEIEIRTISGQLVLKTTSKHIDISHEKNGIYLLTTHLGDELIITKLIKK